MDLSKLSEEHGAVEIDDFLAFVKNQCAVARDLLENSWIPLSIDWIMSQKASWYDKVEAEPDSLAGMRA